MTKEVTKCKSIYAALIFGIFLMLSCDTQKPSSAIPFHVCKQYGAPVSYGEGYHPGIDFEIIQGTPIIAATEGEVSFVGDSDPEVSLSGGIFVRVQNAQHFDLIYGHLSKVYVEKGQLLKRGQLIGISGASNDGLPFLHFSSDFSPYYNPSRKPMEHNSYLVFITHLQNVIQAATRSFKNLWPLILWPSGLSEFQDLPRSICWILVMLISVPGYLSLNKASGKPYFYFSQS